MTALLRRLQAAAGLVLMLMCAGARADTPISLFASFAGYVNFTGTEATMRTSATQPCNITTAQLSKQLSGIPAGATVKSARLYWAGSATTVDSTVTFNSTTINADKTYTAAYTTNGVTYNFFSAAADVTAIVKAKGNGTYTFSGLTVSNGAPWCAVEGVLGGFALLVVYEDHATQPFRVLNVYEGFQYTRNSSLTLSLSNFRVPNPMGAATGRIGHITWEGDDSLSAQGENLSMNGSNMSDTINPVGNQFNSKSNIDGDQNSYGIDFDAYTIGYPTIQPDQTSATTVYASGQDLVLLSAEVVAVPNVPTDDLAISMTRSGQTIPGQNVIYTLQVQNAGPYDEIGPITVVDTLPAGTALVSYSGTGWACSASGQVVTCTLSGTLAAPVAPATATLAPALTLTVAVSASATGSYTNAVSVSGTIFDNVSTNNTASETATDPTVLQGAGMVLTDAPCTDGVAITASNSPCKRITVVTAATATTMYITNLDANGVPKAPKTNGNTNYNPTVWLTCLNPTVAGTTTQATFANTNLPKCVASGSPASPPSVSLNFSNGSPSARFSGGGQVFQYPDVGVLQLNFTDLTSSSITRTARFISQPATLTLAVVRKVDGVGSPMPAINSGFVKAGEQFTVTIGATMANGASPPSFGKESPAVTVGLTQSAQPTIAGSFTNKNNGTFVGDFTYNEVGDLLLGATMGSPLGDYLGSGLAVPGQSQTVGHFYPAYFETSVAPAFACMTRMACLAGTTYHGESLVPSGAAYSGQGFTVTVVPKALDGTVLKNYYGSLANTITITAVAAPGIQAGTVAGGALTTTAGSSPVTIPAPSASGSIATNAMFTLASRYTGLSPASWTAPTPVYLNATAPQTRFAGGTTTVPDPIDSNRRSAAISVEGGIQIINGRLQVANAYGSELLRLPVQIAAQYWTGTAWETNTGDVSVIPAGIQASGCTRHLACGNVIQSPASSATLVTGLGKIWLAAPGAGKDGGALVKMSATPTYLPSTLGQMVFGVYKSPVIYLREVY